MTEVEGCRSPSVVDNKDKVALVTGANRGIGLDIVRQLYHSGMFSIVLLGSRNVEKGNQARDQIVQREETNTTYATNTCQIHVLQLDLNDINSIQNATRHIQNYYPDGLDVVIHNAAAISYDYTPSSIIQSFQTNFYGTVNLSETLIPFVKQNGRVIFVSSAVGKTYLVSEHYRVQQQQQSEVSTSLSMEDELFSPNLTLQQLKMYMEELQQHALNGTYIPPSNGVGGTAYGLGKLGGTTIYPTQIVSKYTSIIKKNIFVATCCPAFGGADTPVWLATSEQPLLNGCSHGKFWEQREITNCKDWTTSMKTIFATTGKYPTDKSYMIPSKH